MQPQEMPTMREVMAFEMEQRLIKFRGRLTDTCNSLGIGRATGYRWLREFKIDHQEIRRAAYKTK